MNEIAASRWADATLAAALFALDPAGLGGIVVRARPGPIRDRWLAGLRLLLPSQAPLRRVPAHIGDERLLGSLDLAATLQARRPVAQRGLLAEADGGVLLLPMAEGIGADTAARLAAALDDKAVTLARDGIALDSQCRIGIVAFDEGVDDEQPPGALMDRAAFRLDLEDIALADSTAAPEQDLAEARRRLPTAVLRVMRGCVLRRLRVHRVQQDIGVRQLHRPCRILATSSSSSSSPASWLALVRSTSGLPMSKVGCRYGAAPTGVSRTARPSASRSALFSTCLKGSPVFFITRRSSACTSASPDRRGG